MALSQAERIQISGEMLDLPLKIQSAIDTEAQVTAVKADLQTQDNSLKIFFDKYNGIADAYQTEQRWIDGTTYTTVIEQDLVDGAKRSAGNKFYPGASWVNFQPKKHASTEGQPTTSSPNSETEILNASAEDGGLIILLDFLLNGQVNAVPSDTLANPYVPGALTMDVTTGGQLANSFLIVEDMTVSALFYVTQVVGLTLTVVELVPPSATLAAGAAVVQNITPFTNSERNTLIAASYQDVLIGLAQLIEDSVDLWETSVLNQQTQLNLNTDSRSSQAAEITAAKADATNALAIIAAWKALPDTGVTLLDSKFVDVNIIPLQDETADRLAFTTTRLTQFSVALGSITQNPDGTYTGTGIYYLRFIQIDNRINLIGGPLTEFYEKDMAVLALQQVVVNANQRSATFSTELRTEGLAQNASGTMVIVVTSATGFSVSNTVFVMADSFTELTGTITAISGNNITLSFVVPNTYTKDKRARLYKQL